MRRLLIAMAVVAFTADSAAAQVSVTPDNVSFAFEAGEAQSTVVPPGLKGQCKAGRLLVTNDWVRPTSTPGATVAGVARWRDLDGAASAESVFDAPPDAADYVYGSNDHNIVTLPNGDVIYQIAGMSKRPIGLLVGAGGGGKLGKALGKLGGLIAKPAWFDGTYRDNFGPGARGSLMTWRSEDCGETFQFVSEIDTAGIGHEECGLPQPLAGRLSAPAKKWDMGGTDGPWLGVFGDRLVATMGCVGYRSKPGVAGYELDPDNPVARNYIFESADRGATWRVLGRYDAPWVWRLAAARLSGGYAFGLWNEVLTADLGGKGVLEGFLKSPAPTGPIGWPEDWFAKNPAWFQPNAKGDPVGVHVCTNGIGWGTAVAAKLPHSDDVILAFPARLPAPAKTPPVGAVSGRVVAPETPLGVALGDLAKLGKLGAAQGAAPAKTPPAETHGFRVIVYRATDGQMLELPPVLPEGGGVNQAAMQLTFVAPEGGPVLAYWYDIDEAADAGAVRARIYYDATRSTKDVTISRAAGAARSFSLARTDGGSSICGPGSYWYGDYRTASAFKAQTRARAATKFPVRGGDTFRYFPVWVEPDKTVRAAEIVAQGKDPQAPAFVSEIDLEPAPAKWKPPGPPREFALPEKEPEIGGLKRAAPPSRF